MNPQTQNQIAEYYAKLPPSVQVMFSSMSWMEILRAISDVHKFSQSQNETLATETTLVLLGMISLDEYKSILFKELNLSKDIFEKVEQEIEEKVIKPVRVELIQAHEKNKADLMEQKYGSAIDERFAKLPPSIREALESVDYQNAIIEIGKNEKLTTTQLGILEEEVTKIMLGIEHREAFRSNLVTKLGISEEKVSSIITAANGHIFAPIRDFFKEESMNQELKSVDYASKKTVSAELKSTENLATQTPQPKIEKIDMDILSKAGIFMDTEINNSDSAQNVELSQRDDMLKNIENPVKTIVSESKKSVVENVAAATPAPRLKQPEYVPSFLAHKLNTTTISTPTTTDHSLPNMSTSTIPAMPEKKVDPYLEPIE